MTRTLFLVFALLYAGIGCAATFGDFTFDVEPSLPVAGAPFDIRVGVAAGSCHRLAPLLPTTALGEHIIRVEVVTSDMCTSNPAQERTYAMPPLAAGSYTFRYALCGVTVFGYSCAALGDETVTVVPAEAAGDIRVVPTLSESGVAVTALIVLLAAFVSLVEQSRRS